MADVGQRGLPQNLLFDLDGTLLDSLPGIAFSVGEALRAAGLPEREFDLRRLIGPPIRTILSKVVESEDAALLDELERHFRASYDSAGWAKTPLYAGAAELLRAMKASGRRLFVVSNKPRHISVRILEVEGVVELFDELVTRDSKVPAHADKLEMLTYLLVKWKISPGECLMIGDTTEDAVAASATDIPFCLMTHGYGDVPVESKVPVAFRLDHFSGLMPRRVQE